MKNEIDFLVYRLPDEDGEVKAVVKDETLWTTQKGMAELFGVDKSTISRHLKNIFSEGELDEKVVVAKIATTLQPRITTRIFCTLFAQTACIL